MTDIGIGVRREDNETWRSTVARVASRHGLARECLELFDEAVRLGEDEGQAALNALSEWDCADLYVDGKPEAGRTAR